jgi:hypothetical protein
MKQKQEKSPATVAAIERHGSISALVRLSGLPRRRIESLDDEALEALSMSFPANQERITHEEREAAQSAFRASGKTLWAVARELGYDTQTRYASLYVALNRSQWHSRHSKKLFKHLLSPKQDE